MEGREWLRRQEAIEMLASELARKTLAISEIPHGLKDHLVRQLSQEIISDYECRLGTVVDYLRTQVIRHRLFPNSRCVGRAESIAALGQLGSSKAWSGVFVTKEAGVSITTTEDLFFVSVLIYY
jgi:hypothetical protein